MSTNNIPFSMKKKKNHAKLVFPPEIKKGMVNFLRKGHFSV